jgi:NADH:ubiquinone oxidoreductase subunit C
MRVICGGIRLYVRMGGFGILYTERVRVLDIVGVLRFSGLFCVKELFDIVGVDSLGKMEVTYGVLSLEYGEKVYLRVSVPYGDSVMSLTSVFKSANWLERELWDMFGIFVLGHGDLRRILTDYGFEGNPMRKGFPLLGYYEVRYDEMEKRIVMEGVSVMQEFRVFEFLSPWS